MSDPDEPLRLRAEATHGVWWLTFMPWLAAHPDDLELAFLAAFCDGYRAGSDPKTIDEIEAERAAIQARMERMKRAQHRQPHSASPTPARRKGDIDAAQLASDVEAEIARHRAEHQRRQVAHGAHPRSEGVTP